MFDQEDFNDSPLRLEEIQKIDATGLSSIERHHLRLLAHCLCCFKSIANGSSLGPLPQEEDRLKWLLAQPALANEEAFASLLLEQFVVAGCQLERLADECKITPLELTLEDLIQYGLKERNSVDE